MQEKDRTNLENNATQKYKFNSSVPQELHVILKYIKQQKIKKPVTDNIIKANVPNSF